MAPARVGKVHRTVARFACALLLAVLSLALVPGLPSGIPTAHAVDCSKKVAILVGGYLSSTPELPPMYAEIIAEAMPGLGYGPPVFFTYKYPEPYGPIDSLDGLPDEGPEALRATIADILAQCPDNSIDLIGHSLGGVAVWLYASRYGDTPEAGHVKHLVMLDAPVNGSSREQLEAAGTMLGSDLTTRSSATYIVGLRANATVPAENVRLANALAPSMIVQQILSSDDLVVPPPDGMLEGFTRMFALGNCCVGRDVSGHWQVTKRRPAIAAIREILSTPVGRPAETGVLGRLTPGAPFGCPSTLGLPAPGGLLADFVGECP